MTNEKKTEEDRRRIAVKPKSADHYVGRPDYHQNIRVKCNSKRTKATLAHDRSSKLSDQSSVFFLRRPIHSSTFLAFQAILESVGVSFASYISVKLNYPKYLS